MKIDIIWGDVTDQETEAVVNSTNAEMYWEDLTINGSFHKKAGSEYTKWCTEYVAKNGRLKIGDIVVSPSFNLKAGEIHNVFAPTVYNKGGYSDDLKRIFYKLCCFDKGTISIPLLGTGVFQIPLTDMISSFILAWYDAVSDGAFPQVQLVTTDVLSYRYMEYHYDGLFGRLLKNET